jgi:acyl-CoA dehydrogenase
MDFSITEEERLVLDGLKAFNEQESIRIEEANLELLHDARRRYDSTGRLVPEVMDVERQVRVAAAKSGYYAMLAPAELGGGGGRPVLTYRVWEFLHSEYGPQYELPYLSVAHWSRGPGPFLLSLPERARSAALPGLMSGEKTTCFAMSEPDAGSDAWMMKTRAVADGDAFVINGSKQWITNGPYADYAWIVAVTDPELVAQRKGGVTCFFAETKTEGFSVDGVIKLFGDIGGDEAILSFHDMRVPRDQVVGEEGQGFKMALANVSTGRLYNSARSVGLSQWALRKATRYSQDRIAFGEPIGNNQGVSFQLADTAIEIYAAKYMGLHCAWLVETGQPAVKEMAMAKAFSTETCWRAYDRAIQVFGGLGISNETFLYKGLHTARRVRIADGSAEILRRTIAQRLFKGDMSF